MYQTISEVKKQFNKYIAAKEPVMISKNGKMISVLVPFEEYREMYRGWQKQIDFEAFEKARNYHNGKADVVSLEELEAALSRNQ